LEEDEGEKGGVGKVRRRRGEKKSERLKRKACDGTQLSGRTR
jgi:hypothetical protein